MSEYTATYSPEDNKLRLYSLHRLDKELYLRVKAAGFRWAPRQELFVAPMWTPGREDLLIELAREIGDEDTSLVDRQEERAERFDGYSDNRAKDAESAHAGVEAITKHIPMGQPILVGHHSEKRARKDAQKIENGMRRAVKMWETSKYWTDRAAGALAHAKYKELPSVRANRIKRIQADLDRVIRSYTPKNPNQTILQQPWYCPVCYANGNRGVYGCKEHLEAEKAIPHVWTGHSRGGSWTPVENIERIKKSYARWVEHYENRLSYEKAMLGEQGELDRLKPKTRPKQLPICNYKAPEGFVLETNMYRRGEFDKCNQVEMTKEEYKAIYKEGRFVRIVENTHRMKATTARRILGYMDTLGLTGIDRTNAAYRTVFVFLTNSKIHPKPEPVEIHPAVRTEKQPQIVRYTPPEPTKFDAMKDQLKEGVQIAVAPQLFPTPPDIAVKMVEYAGIEPGQDILEPSAGTGNILKALPNVRPNGTVTAVEINHALSQGLIQEVDKVHCKDFLSCNGDIGKFDRIIMNPPFEKSIDIKHIRHAQTFLKPGGRLVALCANGPRQQREFMDQAEHWEVLPPGSFKGTGTNVNVALMVLTN